MCGITGICYYGGSRGTVNNTVLDRMCSTLAHRGPDGAGRWISHDRRIGLAMQRLAIRDVARGNQPMIGKHGEVLVFNGEIYNYPALRRGLEREGVSFFTSCDTEVVLRLYEQRGIACLNALNGMFALAIWDPWEEALLMARDGLGEKPLYWADTAGVLLFGSEIKALLEHPLVTPAVNERAISPYLTNLVTSPPDTLYRGVHKLAAGTAVRCDASGVRTWRWCDLLSPEEPQAVAGRDAARTVRLMLERSVDQRLAADVPVGVLLSGGLDSTTLLALLRERTAGLATFSVGFSDHPDLDERAHAKSPSRSATQSRSCPGLCTIRTSRWPTPFAYRWILSVASLAPMECRSSWRAKVPTSYFGGIRATVVRWRANGGCGRSCSCLPRSDESSLP
jgi:asparagine synthase (glutamine-hydrolysing)